MPKGKDAQPVSSVQWIDRELLHANGYNPNHVAPEEMKLLETSIWEDGWTQPIVIRADYEIVDGFHRWTASGRPRLQKMTRGLVPVVFLSDERSAADQQMSTVRHNRARGRHGVVPMAHIVRSLKEEHGLTIEEICDRLGMEDEEVERLLDQAGMPTRLKRDNPDFNKAWEPDL